MTIPQVPLNFEALIPEILLTGFASLILLVGLLKIRNEILVWSSVIFLLILALITPSFEGEAFGGMFLNDFLAIYLKAKDNRNKGAYQVKLYQSKLRHFDLM